MFQTKKRELLLRSRKAVCGIMEREVVVSEKNVAEVKAKLRQKGFHVIGTGPAGPNKKRIWFIIAGGF